MNGSGGAGHRLNGHGNGTRPGRIGDGPGSASVQGSGSGTGMTDGLPSRGKNQRNPRNRNNRSRNTDIGNNINLNGNGNVSGSSYTNGTTQNQNQYPLNAGVPVFVPGGPPNGQTSTGAGHANANANANPNTVHPGAVRNTRENGTTTPRGGGGNVDGNANANARGKERGKAGRRDRKGGPSGPGEAQVTGSGNQPQPKPRQSRRAAAFQGKLTGGADSTSDEDQYYHPHGLADDAMERAATGNIGNRKKGKGALLGAYGTVGHDVEGEMEKEADDLASKLMRGLSRRPFLECPICFSALTPSQAIWSCSPTIYTAPKSSSSSSTLASSVADNSCCYTPFHLACIKDWSRRSLDEAREKARDRDPNQNPLPITWRCPGCQKHREGTVGGYTCFCGAVKNLKTGGGGAKQANGTSAGIDGNNLLGIPHSCGQNCSRRRTYCDHPCPLPCHPGPCPPCSVQLVVPCPSHESPLAVKCHMARGPNVPAPVCEQPCQRPKACGNPNHRCEESCHEPPCETCEVVEVVTCFCGQEEKEVPCGWHKDEQVECVRPAGDQLEGKETERWMGRYGCGKECTRLYDCGIHSCSEVSFCGKGFRFVILCSLTDLATLLPLQSCHPHPEKALICPTSPAIITHCACGQTPLYQISSASRENCTDPIPTCNKRCPQPQSGCDHPCALDCHTGPCPPCEIDVIVPCRCGESKITMKCWQRKESEKENGEAVVLCERVCHALRVCGRHECGRQCCPLSYRAKYKGKKRDLSEADDDPHGLHTCQLRCGKTLSCGLHACPMLDHKGPCGRCLEASYEEMVCHCGRTVIQPPIACGTVMDCTYPCDRPPPLCGHPKTPHTCHEDDECPPCPYLTSKPCACGKQQAVKNVRCSQDKVTCGQICNALLDCGYHHCEKTCHTPGECEECHQTCRKPKKLCKHPCQDLCHAPSSCPEDEPCSTTITQTCACGHLQQRATCGACISNPTSKEAVQLKCIPECQQRQRNARLAEALGIKKPAQQAIEYTPELKVFATNNYAFVLTVEKTFADFFMSPRQAMLLPYTPLAKRQFVLSLAEIYRFTAELIDPEPNRSVQIRRRVDSRIPSPLLSASVSPPGAKRQLGGLGDMKGSTSSVMKPASSSVTQNGWPSSSISGSSTPKLWANLGSTSTSTSASSSRPPSLTSTKPDSAKTALPSKEVYRPPTYGRVTPSNINETPLALTDPNADDWDKSDTEA